MKRTFIYEFKKNLPALIAITAILTLIPVLPVLVSYKSWTLSGASAMLAIISSVYGILAAVIPLKIFMYKMKKRSLDMYYALPVSHTKLLTAKYLAGLLLILIPFTVTYWLHVVCTAMVNIQPAYNYYTETYRTMQFIYYLPQYFASIIPLYIIYSISSFVFTRANNVTDGIVFLVLWLLAVPLLMTVIDALTDSMTITVNEFNPDFESIETTDHIQTGRYFIFAPLNDATAYFQKMLTSESLTPLNAQDIGNLIASYTITSLMSIGSTVGIILLERKAKAENCQQISESWFGYKTMIPAYTACIFALIFGISWDLYIVFAIMIIVGAYLMSVLYKRKLAIGKKQLIILAIAFAAGLILGVICVYATPTEIIPTSYPVDAF